MSDAADNLSPAAAAPQSRVLHALAIFTACATFPLIFLGGLVTSHGAGMSVPDWPNSYGYNMFTFPPSQWVGGILYEHTHRLMGTVVGLGATLMFMAAWGFGRRAGARRVLLTVGALFLVLTVATAGVAAVRKAHLTEGFGFLAVLLVGSGLFRRPEPRRWVRWTTTAVLVGVIFQGVLGGLRVVMVELDLAIVHACFAQAFFCLVAFTAVATSRWWAEQAEGPSVHAEGGTGRSLVRLAGVAVVAVYLQLIAGALMRHYGAGLAIPDVPLNYGHALPPVSETGLKLANEARVFDLQLPRVTLFQVWIHFTHRVGAVLVTAAVLGAVLSVVRRHRAGACWGMITGTFAATLGGLVCLCAAHAVGSTRGVLPGFVFFASAVACGFAARATLRRLGPARALLGPAAVLAALLVVQVTLGVLTVVLRKPADVASAHVAVGALLLVTAFVLTVRAARLYSPFFRTAGRQGFTAVEPSVEARPAPAAACIATA